MGSQKVNGRYTPVHHRLATHWVLERPGIFLNSVGDVTLLPILLDAAEDLGAGPDDPAMAALAERTGLSSIFGI